MGKDKNKDGLALPKTKDMLKSDNVKLTQELRRLQCQYDELYTVVHQLNIQYEMSKQYLPATRYIKLKDQIKAAFNNDIITKTEKFLAQEREAKEKKKGMAGLVERAKEFSDGATGSSTDVADGHPHAVPPGRKKRGGMSGLLEASREMAGGPPKCKWESKKALSDMRKHEVLEDNEKMKQQIEKMHTKFLRVCNRIDKLRRDYELSKAHSFSTRYALMKEMVKTVTTDKGLKPD
ncbi:hypothetical protein ScPMuIL_004382 [Solemya velum]